MLDRQAYTGQKYLSPEVKGIFHRLCQTALPFITDKKGDTAIRQPEVPIGTSSFYYPDLPDQPTVPLTNTSPTPDIPKRWTPSLPARCPCSA